jgi:hypothetical protein
MIALNLLPLFFLLLAKSISDKIQSQINPLSSMESPYTVDMKKVGVGFGIIVSIFTLLSGWITVKEGQQKNSTRLDVLEVQADKIERKLDARFDRVMDKLDVIEDKLSNKQDRK